ncbi:uncharacterized protein [Enoplosus armatus]|uniref:uncharacterized protein n=1 Tax=Enoplosus armatus TaxID=215367 RepID=UPI00399416C8
MFAVFSVALLCLVSVSHAAPLACEELVRPLDQLDPHHLEGTRALAAGSMSPPFTLEDLKLRGSVTQHFSNSSETSVYFYNHVNRLGVHCYYWSYNFSIESSTFTHHLDNSFKLTGSFLYTSCPDCVVMHWVLEKEKMASVDLYLFSRRREVEQKEMEEFRAQVKCLSLPPPVVMDPATELCPKEPAGDPAAPTEDKTEGQKA